MQRRPPGTVRDRSDFCATLRDAGSGFAGAWAALPSLTCETVKLGIFSNDRVLIVAGVRCLDAPIVDTPRGSMEES